MKEIISMHGWGGDSSVWEQWEKYFKGKGWFWQNIDRGYGIIQPKKAEWLYDPKENIPQKKVIICYSLGAHLIPREIFKDSTAIVLISGFGRFVTESRESRPLKTALEGMQKAIGSQNENKMLVKFHKKACIPYKFKVLPSGLIQKNLSFNGRKKLQSDLKMLINTKGLPSGLPSKSRLLAIFGQKDSILLSSSINALLNELNNYLNDPPTHWTRPNEGHYLFKPDLIKCVERWLELSA